MFEFVKKLKKTTTSKAMRILYEEVKDQNSFGIPKKYKTG